jgi:hypothetical protein
MWPWPWGIWADLARRSLPCHIWPRPERAHVDEGPGHLTNSIAITLALIVIFAIAGDQYFQDGAGLLFLMKKFADMLEWMAFWR